MTALWQVTGLTLAAMLVELAAGYCSGSLALTADGWHMGTHALALGGVALAMRLARRAVHNPRFACGGRKIEMLAAYSSALLLLGVSLSLLVQAVQHLVAPQPIAYEEVLVVTALGLLVNLLSIWLPGRPGRNDSARTAAQQHHHHGHSHERPHHHGAPRDPARPRRSQLPGRLAACDGRSFHLGAGAGGTGRGPLAGLALA